MKTVGNFLRNLPVVASLFAKREDEVTDLEIFKAFIKDRFGFTHCDVGQTHGGKPWVSFADEWTYTFFNFSYEDDSFTGCFSRRYSDHAEIETPAPMLGLRDDFQELRERAQK